LPHVIAVRPNLDDKTLIFWVRAGVTITYSPSAQKYWV